MIWKFIKTAVKYAIVCYLLIFMLILGMIVMTNLMLAGYQ